MANAHEPNLKAALSATPDCPALEKLAAWAETKADPQIAAHAAGCAHCQAELALLREFQEGTPRPDEEIPVQWITSKLKSQQPVAVRKSGFSTGVRSWMAAAAALILISAGALYVRQGGREPALHTGGGDVVRSQTVEAVAPLGDIAGKPSQFQWRAVSGAARYEIVLTEVDRTELWRSTVTGLTATVPPEVAAIIQPGKTLQWEVLARDASGAKAASSGVQVFRVK